MIVCRHLLGWLLSAFRSRQDLILENLALRQQLLTLHAQRPRRRFTTPQKLFWVLLRKGWAGWSRPLLLVTPRTVVGWHRAGFRLYWKWLSRVRSTTGRKPLSPEVRALIFQMVAENPTWGAPRIHGELLMLGFVVSEATVSRWMRRAPRSPALARRWLSFLRNQREAIAAMDFVAKPTLTFGVLYCHPGACGPRNHMKTSTCRETRHDDVFDLFLRNQPRVASHPAPQRVSQPAGALGFAAATPNIGWAVCDAICSIM